MSGKVSLARQVAFDIFAAVEGGDQRLDEVQSALFQEYQGRLSRLDRNFITEIVYGTLRWRGKLYWILQNTSKRDLSTTSPFVRTALLCGAYQVYYMDRVPDRAAVNESVEYVRARGEGNACSFINGIMRQIARKAQYFPKPDKVAKPAEYLTVQYAHPQWMVERWLKRFKFERMEKILAANNRPPPHTIRINSIKHPIKDADDLQTALLRDEKTHSERRPLRCALHLQESPDLTPESMFAQGLYTIQDEAAQLISYLLAPKKGDQVLDVCTGKGGKLSHLYELLGGESPILGIEKSAEQAELCQETMNRLGFTNFKVIVDDFLNFNPEQKYNKILLDAPCTGFGILRRHPEGKWQKPESLIREMEGRQRVLLRKAWDLLEVGGELVFAVCSFESEETEGQLNFAKENFAGQCEVINPSERLPDYYRRYVTRDDILLIFPGNSDEMDGFGAFILKKTPKH